MKTEADKLRGGLGAMSFFTFNQLPLYTDDFYVRELTDWSKKDAIVIFHPADALVVSPAFFRSRKTLTEHIEYIRANGIKSAIVIADDIRFLLQCPSLECLWIMPSVYANDFDYSPLYEMPNIRWLRCETRYGKNEEKTTHIDFSRFPNLQTLSVSGAQGNHNVQGANCVSELNCHDGYPNAVNLLNALPGLSLERLNICESRIRSLEGIDASPRIRRLELAYNRCLTDISALRYLKDSLIYLEINACGKIRDFSVLSELKRLEYLILKGNNVLTNLDFLRNMPSLQYIHLTMDVEDGDVGFCKQLTYARIKNRKHFSHKDNDMPKGHVERNEYLLH